MVEIKTIDFGKNKDKEKLIDFDKSSFKPKVIDFGPQPQAQTVPDIEEEQPIVVDKEEYISPYGKTFGEIYETVKALKELGAPDENVNKFLQQKNFTRDNFEKKSIEFENYYKSPEKKLRESLTGEEEKFNIKEDISSEFKIAPPIYKAAKSTTEVLGKVIGSLGDPGKKVVTTVDAVRDFIVDKTPVGIKDAATAVFDPYQDDGIITTLPQDMTQFLIPFAGLGKIGKLPGLNLIIGESDNLAKALIKTSIRGGAADVLAFDEDQARLANLLVDKPVLGEGVKQFMEDYLIAKPEDTFAQKKLKQFAEGMGLGLSVDVLFRAAKGLFDFVNPKPKDLTGITDTLGDTLQEEVAKTGSKQKSKLEVKEKNSIRETIGRTTKEDEVLVFGAGKPDAEGKLTEIEVIKEKTSKVTPYDLEKNMTNELGDELLPAYKGSQNALEKQYDKVVASDVVDSLPTVPSVKATLNEISNATKKNGEAVIDFKSNNKSKMSQENFESNLKQQFGKIEKVGEKGFRGGATITYKLSKPKRPIIKQELFKNADGRTTIASKMSEDIGFFKKNFTSRQGMTDEMFNMFLKNKGKKEIIQKDIEKAIRDLQKSIKKDFGTTKLTDKQSKLINDALAGGEQVGIVRTLYKNVGNSITQMRKVIDKLSKELIETGAVDEKLAAKIDNNIGTYLNRSYLLYTDPKYSKNIRQKNPLAIQRAREALKSINKKASDEQIEGLLNSIIDKADLKLNDVIDSIGDNKIKFTTDSKALKKRKDIIPELRAMMGEIEDPFANFAQTYSKLSNMLNDYKLYKDLSDYALKEGIALKTPQALGSQYTVDVKDLGKSGPIKSPFQGLFSNKVFTRAVQDGIEIASIGDGVLNAVFTRPYLMYKSSSQLAKTVLSHITHLRNMSGAAISTLANGNISGFYKTVKVMKDYFTDRKNFDNITEYLLENGLLNSSVDYNILRKTLDDIKGPGDMENFFSKIFKPVSKISKVYAFEDNIFKLAGFFSELNRYKKIYKNSTGPYNSLLDAPQEAVDRALTIARDTMPNYNLTPRGVQMFRRLPFFGNFITFAAESVRSGMSILRRGYQEILDGAATGNVLLTQTGMARLGSFAAVLGLPSYLSIKSRLKNNISDEADIGIKELLPEYLKTGDIYYLSPLEFANNGDVMLTINNMAYTNPYAMWREPFNAAYVSYQKNKDYDNVVVAIAKAAKDSTKAFFSPFLQETMVSKALLNVLLSTMREDEIGGSLTKPVFQRSDTVPQKFSKAVGELIGPVTPGTLESLYTLIQTGLSEQKKGMGLTKDGSPKPFDLELLKNITGIGPQKLNLSKLYAYKVNDFVRLIDTPPKQVAKKLRDQTELNPQNVYNMYEKEIFNEFRMARNFAKFQNNLMDTGMSKEDMQTAIERAGYSDRVKSNPLINSIIYDNDMFIPKQILTPTNFINIIEKQVPEVDVDILQGIYNKYINKELLGEEDEQ
mgnify:FL=1|tara:strand:+ start:8558 stop:12946 length:4389 start_codon:yes stop_codon:yes gene_type:complete